MYNNVDEYVLLICHKKGGIYQKAYRLGYQPEDFIRKFQTSPIADEWDAAAGHYYIDWPDDASARAFTGDLGKYNMRVEEAVPDKITGRLGIADDMYDEDILYWVGLIYEMWIRYTGISSRRAYEQLDFFDMYAAWDMGHMSDPYHFMLGLSADPASYKIV